jgi:hypothetical protein
MRLSETLQTLLEDYSDRPLPLSALLDSAGSHGFGMISGLLTIPMLLPIPLPLAGFSTIMGAGVALMGLQLALGFQQPFLPPRLARIALSPSVSKAILGGLTRILRPVERLARARLLRVSENAQLRRLLGVCLAWSAVLMGLPLPIPFTNMLPAYTILLLTIGILESDGLLILVGYGMTAATSVFFVSIGGVIWGLIQHLLQVMGH